MIYLNRFMTIPMFFLFEVMSELFPVKVLNTMQRRCRSTTRFYREPEPKGDIIELYKTIHYNYSFNHLYICIYYQFCILKKNFFVSNIMSAKFELDLNKLTWATGETVKGKSPRHNTILIAS